MVNLKLPNDIFLFKLRFFSHKNQPYPKLTKCDNSDVIINNKQCKIVVYQFISHQNDIALPYIFGRFVLIVQFQGCYCWVVRGGQSPVK
ncbi:hypothetical protein B4903_13040 [Yersinia frederiksenii]|nr:hypothetical protein B4903_13040 [Yersinia frederiksenii]